MDTANVPYHNQNHMLRNKHNVYTVLHDNYSSNLLRWSFRRNREQYAQSVKWPQWHLDLPALQSDTTVMKNSFQENGLLNGSLSSALRLRGEARLWRVSFISSSFSKTSGWSLIIFLLNLVGMFDPVSLVTFSTTFGTGQTNMSTSQTFNLIIPKFRFWHRYSVGPTYITLSGGPDTASSEKLFFKSTTAYYLLLLLLLLLLYIEKVI